MNPTVEFISFPKISRYSRPCTITEKIDGTNAQIYISDDLKTLKAGSRNRWLSLDADNFGFCAWVVEHQEELLQLGPGRHFGEWWGSGIQSNYGLTEKRFSLFNTHRWGFKSTPPACCGVVPLLYEGLFTEAAIEDALARLIDNGSFAAPGFSKPEGIVIYHHASGQLFKKTLLNDAYPKGLK